MENATAPTRKRWGIPDDVNATFGARAKVLRGERSQEAIAGRMRDLGHASWRQTKVSKVEAGQVPITLDEAYCLALVLGAHLRDFLDEGPGELQRRYDSAVTRVTALHEVRDDLERRLRDAEREALSAMSAIDAATRKKRKRPASPPKSWKAADDAQ